MCYGKAKFFLSSCFQTWFSSDYFIDRKGTSGIAGRRAVEFVHINENADPSVRTDFERSFNHLIPENQSYYTHVLEGSDDMPAHLKSSVIGVSLTVPIRNKKLALGTWQGIYLCEFRDYGGPRKLIATIWY